MHVKLVITLLISAMLSWFAVSAAFAATSSTPHTQSAQLMGAKPPASGGAINQGASVTGTLTTTVTLSPGNEMIAKAIAERFKVDVNEVLKIHDQIHGWGEVFLVFSLADRSGKSPEQILAMRESDGGWGRIFMALGLHPGLKKDNLGGAITGRPTPTAAPSNISSTKKHKPETHDLNDDPCNEHASDDDDNDENEKEPPCGKPASSQFPFGHGHSNHQQNNKGKGD